MVLLLILGSVAGYLAIIGPNVVTTTMTASTRVTESTTVTTSKTVTAAAPIPATYVGIGDPFNSSQLASINNQPLSNYEKAGEMLLNGTIANRIALGKSLQYQPLMVNGKPSVVVLQAISCPDCAQNRWAQAIAMAAFGNFTALYKGYSALGTNHVTTLFWGQDNFTTNQGSTFGSSYNSKYLNFYPIDYDTPVVTGGFQWTTLDYFAQHAPNSTWLMVVNFMQSAAGSLGNKAPPTDTQLWGSSVWFGGIAVIYGNSTSFSGTAAPITRLSHDSALAQISKFSDQYAWSIYAAADVYIAGVCPSLANAPAVCSLPAIVALEGKG